MNELTVHKTFKDKLSPTPEQERVLDYTLMLCRQVYRKEARKPPASDGG